MKMYWQGQYFQHVRLFADSAKKTSRGQRWRGKTVPKTEGKRDAEAMQKTLENDQQLSHFGCQNHAKTSPEAAFDAKLAPRACWEALGLDFGGFWDPQTKEKSIQN